MVRRLPVVLVRQPAKEDQELDVGHLVRLGWIPDRIDDGHHRLCVDGADVHL